MTLTFLFVYCFLFVNYYSKILLQLCQLHSNSPNPSALGPGTARNSEMSYMYTTIKNTSSVTILWKILCNFSLFKQGKAGQWSADLAVIAASWGTGT